MRALRESIYGLAMASGLMLAAGCPPANHRAASPGAPQPDLHLVAEGKNTELTFKAPQNGTIFVYDFDQDQMVYQGPMAAGEQFVLDPVQSLATVNKQRVELDHVTNALHEYRLYFHQQ